LYNISHEQNVSYKVYHDIDIKVIINSIKFVNLLLPAIIAVMVSLILTVINS